MMRQRWMLAVALAAACGIDEPESQLAQVSQEMNVCADGPTTYGIDVSRFQGDIDWQQVANADVKFAWIQISRSLTDIDAKFAYNWRRAKEVGILRGAYQRFQPGQDVIGQAKLFLEKLGPYVPGDLPPMLDVEDSNGLTGPQIAAAVQQWMDYVEARVPVKPLIYTGYYFWRDTVGGPDFDQYPLWIPNYSATCPLVPPTWTRWAIHQYSSSATIPGITANTVDVNKFNGTYAQLQALAAVAECGDATCNGDETADSCPADCQPCQVIEGDQSIIDDGGKCFVVGGNPQFMRTENAGFGSSLRWTHATAAAEAANSGRWNLHFAEPGKYRLEAFTPAPYNGSKQTVYKVRHGETAVDVSVDQSAVDGWNVIGEYEFVAGGHDQHVFVGDNTGEAEDTMTKIVFDAIRVTKIAKADGDGDGDGDGDDPMAGGCSTSSGAGWLVIALAALLLRRRR